MNASTFQQEMLKGRKDLKNKKKTKTKKLFCLPKKWWNLYVKIRTAKFLPKQISFFKSENKS